MPRWIVGCSAVIAAVALTGACGGGSDPTPRGGPAASGAVIRLGSFLPLSGPNAEVGQGVRAAEEMAVADINAAGGILGRQIVLTSVDGACDPAQTVAAAQQLVAAGVDVSVGGMCSSSLPNGLYVLRQKGIPHVEPAANSSDLLKNPYPGLFLMLGTVTDEAAATLPLIVRLGVKHPVVVHDGTSFPLTLATSVTSALRTAKRPAVATIGISPAARSYPAVATRIIASGADAVYYTGYYREAGILIRDLRAKGFTGPFIAGDGSASPAIVKTAGAKTLKDVYLVTPPVPDLTPSAADWLKRYRAARTADPDPFGMLGYATVLVAADAVKRAGSTDPAAVTQALLDTRVSTPYGVVRFDSRHVASTGFQVVTIVDGALTAE